MSILRGRYYGFYVSGDFRGQVQESQSSVLIVARAPQTMPIFRPDDMLAEVVEVRTETYHHHSLVVVNRLYGVWLDHILPQQEDMDAAVLTLIDMDPLQARLCEIERR